MPLAAYCFQFFIGLPKPRNALLVLVVLHVLREAIDIGALPGTARQPKFQVALEAVQRAESNQPAVRPDRDIGTRQPHLSGWRIISANGIRNPWQAFLRTVPTMWVAGFILAGAGKAARNKRH